MSNLSKGTSNTVHGYTIIKLNITIAALKIDHIRNYPKNSPIPFPRLSPTLNFSFSFKRSIACNERKQKRGKGFFVRKVRGVRPYQLPSLGRRGGGERGRGCKLSRESGEERFKSDLHDIWPAHSPGTLFRVTILSRRFRVCIKISTTANSDLVLRVGPTKKAFARILLGIMAHCRELDKAFLSRTTRDTISNEITDYRFDNFTSE